MNMRLPLAILSLATAALLTGPARAGTIDPDRLRAHVAILASDDYLGREAGGPADRKSTTYIANAFEKAGLAPAGEKDKWLQPVPLIRQTAIGWRVTLRMRGGKGKVVTLDPRALALIGDTALTRIENAPIIFVGHGIVDPATGRDDLSGADLKGAVILRLANAPPEYAAGGRAPPDIAARRALYLSRGAIAEIAINSADDAGFARLLAGYQRGLMKLDIREKALALTGHVRSSAIEPLLASGGLPIAGLKAKAAVPTFRAIPLDLRLDAVVATRLTRFRSANVVARLDGVTHTNEAVVLSAHWDGHGLCLPRNEPDRICNGAIDNASGVAGLIELAYALKQGERPARTILFIATTAEEYGLLGAEYYTRNPATPLANTIGGINLDTIALRPRGAKIGIIGRGLTTLDPIITDAASAQGRDVLDDPSIQQYFRRSDQYAFARRGVPMVMVTGLFSRETAKGDAIDRYFDERYHKPGDELEAIPTFDGAAEDMDLVLRAAREIANAAARPMWLPDSPYQRN